VKGGSGTTVVAAALAVLLARRLPEGALLVDAGGDLGCVLGLPETGGPGLADWLRSPAEIDGAALERLTVAAGPGLSLVPRGAGEVPSGQADRLLGALAAKPVVVVDAGPPSPFATELAAQSTLSLLVLRPCYLALRRALAAPVRPSGVIVVEEPRRSLDVGDIESVLGVPVHAVVPWDHGIARAVDAGLLGARLPRPLASALQAAA
jgi:Flp pilus assembly CpaE family ATPase